MILAEYDEEKYRAMERKEWIEEGEKQGKALSVLELLEDYGPVPDDIRQRILNEHNEQVLRKWLRLAARARSLDKFLKELKD